MLASFSVVPMGGAEGVKEIIAEALAIVDNSGLPYELGPMHTVIEGKPEEVIDVILRCHRRVLELAPRVLTNITIDDRKGATGRLEGKVRDVEEIMGKKLFRFQVGPAIGKVSHNRRSQAKAIRSNGLSMRRATREGQQRIAGRFA